MNGRVERGQATQSEEFLVEVIDGDLEIVSLNQSLRAWERTYNTIRPHQALGYLTPQQFVTQWQRRGKGQCVTDLLDEYTSLTRVPLGDRFVRAVACSQPEK